MDEPFHEGACGVKRTCGACMKQNILFLMADQFTYDTMSCMGSCARTPNLDRIAQSAVCFSNCYTNAPLCMPARTSLATGLYPEELNTVDNYGTGLTPQSSTWMQRVRDAGYETSLFGKAHLHKFCPDLRDKISQMQGYGYQIVDELPGPRTYATVRSSYYEHLKSRGLLRCYEEDMKRRYEEGPVYDSRPTPLPTKDYADVYIADRALDYLGQVSPDVPWFCTVSFGGPHDPWDTPAEYVLPYQDVIPPPARPAPVSIAPDRPRGVYDEILNGKYDPSLTPDIKRMTQQDIQALRRSYYGHVTLIDDQIGRILTCLERRGMLEHTIIVFTADHGEENGDYGLLFKQTFLESSVRVPLLISIPGETRRSIHTPVELMDLGPTVCHLVGIEGQLGHARSLLPLMQGGIIEKQRLASQIFGETMLLEKGIKVVFNQEDIPYLLFDLNSDPMESYNLAGTPQVSALEHYFCHALAEWRQALMQQGGVHT